MSSKSDIEIARAATKLPIQQIGDKLGIPAQDLLPRPSLHTVESEGAEGVAQHRLLLVVPRKTLARVEWRRVYANLEESDDRSTCSQRRGVQRPGVRRFR